MAIPKKTARKKTAARKNTFSLTKPLKLANPRLWIVLAAVVIVGVAVVAFSSAASATPEIKSALASKCLDDYQGRIINGNKVESFTCNGSYAQRWVINSDHTVRLGGKCLDVYQQARYNGAKIDLYTCNGGANQKWTLNSAHELVGAQSGRCLDIPGYNTANGVQLELYTCSGGANQRWYPSQFVIATPTPTSTPTPSQTPTNGSSTPTPTSTGPFTLAWSADFSTDKPLGSFANCSEDSCPSVPGWGAYPSGWPDTATERGGYAVGGYYDPGSTTWISGDQLHIKLWRGASGSVHSDTLVPLAAFGKTYGKYVETFRVSKITTGYKSAHLLYSTGNQNDEVDYPEAQWDDSSIYAYIHYREGNLPQQSFNSGVNWANWHTSEVDWTPGHLAFYMDGKLIGSSTSGVPSTPMKWAIQNESALDGETAPLNSSAQMDISSVAYYAYK